MIHNPSTYESSLLALIGLVVLVSLIWFVSAVRDAMEAAREMRRTEREMRRTEREIQARIRAEMERKNDDLPTA